MPKLKVPMFASKEGYTVHQSRQNGTLVKSSFQEAFGASDDEEGDEDAFVGFDPTDIGKERVSLCEQLFQKTVALYGNSKCRKSSRPHSSLDRDVVEELCGSSKKGKKGLRKRGMRCMQCPACLRLEDCGVCTNCRDKVKFGGPGIRKQACIHRKCHHLVRDIPTKTQLKRTSACPLSEAPVHKRPASAEGQLLATPVRPRRVLASPQGGQLLELCWEERVVQGAGFPVYSPRSDSPSLLPLCFSCGSAGRIPLVRCSVCCQAFHGFCLVEHSESQFTCSSCISCAVCRTQGNLEQCVSCKQWYHLSCFSCHCSSAGCGLWRCPACTKCVSCKTSAPGAGRSWHDDFTYCQDCYELKLIGNYCPVCGECYSENDFDSKMVQCGKCDHWIHSKCEGMTDEEYEILSDLPEDDVLFLCSLCRKQVSCNEEGLPNWRRAVHKYRDQSFAKMAKEMFGAQGSLVQVSVASQASVLQFSKEVIKRLGESLSSRGLIASLNSAVATFLQLLKECFPWFDVSDVSLPDTAPSSQSESPVPFTAWPSALLNDHCYVQGPPAPPPPLHSPPQPPTDKRVCLLCLQTGDLGNSEAGRLLPCGCGEWVHINCAIWSAEVYEELSGVLRCVHAAISRGTRLRCDRCRELGATVGCCNSTCAANFHFMCARESGCVFLGSKEVFCHAHRHQGEGKEHFPESEFLVFRPVWAEVNWENPGKKALRMADPLKLQVQIGSLCIHQLGELVELSDTPTLLLPVHFRSSVEFWSASSPSTSTYQLEVSGPALPRDMGLLLPPPSSSDAPPAGDSHLDTGAMVTVGGCKEELWHSALAADGEQRKTKCHPAALRPFRIPKTASSEPSLNVCAEAESACLRRYRSSQRTNPFSLWFTISSDGKTWRGSDLQELWLGVLAELQEQRARLALPFAPPSKSDVYRQFGLRDQHMLRLIEQLPHANKCCKYQFKYHQPSSMSSWCIKREVVNATGSARSEGYNGIRSPSDMFSFLTSDLRPPKPEVDLVALESAVALSECSGPLKLQPSCDLPTAMRYRSLQKTYKQHVGVFGSSIHGLGLYCLQEIEPGEMVIEYAGTVIRSILTDKRENLYDSKGIGCYMFRIDADLVVDATMSGNEARFINHSCEPNCYSKVITVDGQKKIMIFALRKIVPGEELTYDYKFPLEEAKIPCNCGSRKCRKTLN